MKDREEEIYFIATEMLQLKIANGSIALEDLKESLKDELMTKAEQEYTDNKSGHDDFIYEMEMDRRMEENRERCE